MGWEKEARWKKRSLVVSGAGDVDDGCERIPAAAAAGITPISDQLRARR